MEHIPFLCSPGYMFASLTKESCWLLNSIAQVNVYTQVQHSSQNSDLSLTRLLSLRLQSDKLYFSICHAIVQITHNASVIHSQVLHVYKDCI